MIAKNAVDVVPVTVVMLTLNEAFHLPDVLENLLGWAEDVFIVDSGSSDGTVEIAKARGVKIVQRPFDNFGGQWNFALSCLPIETPWVLKIDPDERISDELKESIFKATLQTEGGGGYSFGRRLWFMGKQLHVIADVTRLWRTGRCRFSDVLVNEHPLIDGEVRRLNGLLEHYDSRDLHHWTEKQNVYSTLEAITVFEGRELAAEPKFFGSHLERRMYLKSVFSKVPFRFQAQFLIIYLVKGAWRDGYVGLAWARLRVYVSRMREFKLNEMRRTKNIPNFARTGIKWDPEIAESDLQLLVLKREIEVARGASNK